MTVVICPSADGEPTPEWATALAAQRRDVILVAPAVGVFWVAHTAMALRDLQSPIVLVAYGAATALVPTVGFAARSSRKPVSAYILVDGPLPSAEHRTTDWPDAPVTCVCDADSDMAHQAQLRGWQVVSGDISDAVTAASAT